MAIFVLPSIIRTYAAGVLAGVTQRVDGAAGPREPSFPPTPGGFAARGGRKEEFFGGLCPPNLPTAYLLIGISNARNRLDQTGTDPALLAQTGSAPTALLRSCAAAGCRAAAACA